MLFGPRPWILRNSSAARRELLQQQIAALAGTGRHDLFQHERQPLPMPGISVTLRSGIFEDVFDPLGMAFDSGGAVAIAADAERIFAGDLHQIGGLPEDAGDLLVLQAESPVTIVMGAGAKK